MAVSSGAGIATNINAKNLHNALKNTSRKKGIKPSQTGDDDIVLLTIVTTYVDKIKSYSRTKKQFWQNKWQCSNCRYYKILLELS